MRRKRKNICGKNQIRQKFYYTVTAVEECISWRCFRKSTINLIIPHFTITLFASFSFLSSSCCLHMYTICFFTFHRCWTMVSPIHLHTHLLFQENHSILSNLWLSKSFTFYFMFIVFFFFFFSSSSSSSSSSGILLVFWFQ